ncbi:hypothetical protein FSP39_014772 [Pinctada imbricata]|uniref:Uncharacterized protein n=1 Tax=Pinctada imbricata TaxID=66713 RepID=A0AA88XUY5_PINIB|nr:hypothetical protein FSP39_014772 [Pinctada imbricata]
MHQTGYENHPCIRECHAHSSMTCEYNFTAEYYYTLSRACYNCPFNATDCHRPHCVPADGTARAITVINRMLPGPAIHICLGDTVIVNLYNKLEGHEGLTIHWHGVHQDGSPHMDGCTNVNTVFKPSNPGTHFWHAHSGLQRADGIFGGFIVREPKEQDSHLGFYDLDLPEHTLLVNDWLVELAIERFANHHHATGDNKPASMLINGKGVFAKKTNDRNETSTTPYHEVKVQRGRRYRFRLISNGLLNCPIQFSIDNHTLIVIASDGNSFDPELVESLNIFAGERYDFVLHTNMSVGNYWIRIRGEGDCNVKRAHQHAILRYDGSDMEEPIEGKGYEASYRNGTKLNPWNKKGTDELIPVTRLHSHLPNDEALRETPDKKFYLRMDFYRIDNYRFHDPDLYPLESVVGTELLTPQINYITTILPPAPVLTQLNDVPKELFCNEDTVNKNCTEEFCECVHVLKVDLNDVVEFIVVDEGKIWDANHPMHLHGYSYRVIGMDRLNSSTTLEQVKKLDEAGLLHRNFNYSVAKDTVTVPDGGYVILRIHATNPGFWFFHCHIEFHAEIGMGVVLQVGDVKDMPKAPKGFPKCGPWTFNNPTTYMDDDDYYDAGQNERCSNLAYSNLPNLTNFAFCIVLFLAVIQF